MLNRMKSPAFAAWSIFLCALPLAAQLEDADAAIRNKCAEYEKTPLPPEASEIAQPKAWPDCNSYKRYSGIGEKVDYAAALQCAWSERLAQQAGLRPTYTIASVFGGSAMLSVLYANGQGVEKEMTLALRLPARRVVRPRRFLTGSTILNLGLQNQFRPRKDSLSAMTLRAASWKVSAPHTVVS
jgi:hypothetical protein